MTADEVAAYVARKARNVARRERRSAKHNRLLTSRILADQHATA